MTRASFEVLRREARAILAPRGWLDLSNVSALSDRVEGLLAEAPDLEVVGIDFAETEYIDSAAVSALIQAKSSLEAAGIRLDLVALSRQVRRVLEETRLIEIFPVHAGRAQFFAAPAPETAPGPTP